MFQESSLLQLSSSWKLIFLTIVRRSRPEKNTICEFGDTFWKFQDISEWDCHRKWDDILDCSRNEKKSKASKWAKIFLFCCSCFSAAVAWQCDKALKESSKMLSFCPVCSFRQRYAVERPCWLCGIMVTVTIVFMRIPKTSFSSITASLTSSPVSLLLFLNRMQLNWHDGKVSEQFETFWHFHATQGGILKKSLARVDLLLCDNCPTS